MALPFPDPQACDELQDILLFISRQNAERHADTPCTVLFGVSDSMAAMQTAESTTTLDIQTPIGTEPILRRNSLSIGLEYWSASESEIDEPRSDVTLVDNLLSLLRRQQVSFGALRGHAQSESPCR
jgi:hypothetical protein